MKDRDLLLSRGSHASLPGSGVTMARKIKPSKVVKTTKGKYSIHFISASGERRRWLAGDDQKEAFTWAHRFDEWLLDGKDPEREVERAQRVEQAKAISLQQFFPIFLERYGKYQSEGQQLNYRGQFESLCRCPKLAECPLSSVSKVMVSDYLRLRIEQDGIKPATANHGFNFINSMLNRAVEWDVIERNPLIGFKKFRLADKRDVVLTPEQADTLLEALPERLAGICRLAIYTGFRLNNILGMRIEAVRFHDLTATGEVDLRIKGGRLETFALSKPAVEVIVQAIGQRVEGYVFINPETGTRYRRSGINTFYRIVRKLGLKAKDGSPFRFHDLRHVFATRVTDLGVSLDQLRLLLGHKDRSTTDRYVTYDRKAVGERLSALSGLGK